MFNIIFDFFSPNPKPTWDSYELFQYIAGGIHNVVTFVLLISYLLLNHPKLPDVRGFCQNLTLVQTIILFVCPSFKLVYLQYKILNYY